MKAWEFLNYWGYTPRLPFLCSAHRNHVMDTNFFTGAISKLFTIAGIKK